MTGVRRPERRGEGSARPHGCQILFLFYQVMNELRMNFDFNSRLFNDTSAYGRNTGQIERHNSNRDIVPMSVCSAALNSFSSSCH